MTNEMHSDASEESTRSCARLRRRKTRRNKTLVTLKESRSNTCYASDLYTSDKLRTSVRTCCTASKPLCLSTRLHQPPATHCALAAHRRSPRHTSLDTDPEKLKRRESERRTRQGEGRGADQPLVEVAAHRPPYWSKQMRPTVSCVSSPLLMGNTSGVPVHAVRASVYQNHIHA
jgi:hypothetical protein